MSTNHFILVVEDQESEREALVRFLKIEHFNAVGAENVYEPALQMGAEDFAYYAKEVPAMFFFVGATAPGIDPETAPGNHSPEFMLDETSLDVGLRALLQVSLDYLHGPG